MRMEMQEEKDAEILERTLFICEHLRAHPSELKEGPISIPYSTEIRYIELWSTKN